MNDKGFTLIEILAAVIILGLVLIFAIPKVIEVINDSKQKLYNQQLEIIKNQAKEYVSKNTYTLAWKEDKAYVLLSQLISSGLVKSGTKNPITGEAFDTSNTYVVVSKNGEKYTYSVVEASNQKPINKTYGGNGVDELAKVVKAEDGGYFLVGLTTASNGDVTDTLSGVDDVWIMKVDKYGNKLWNKTYGGSGTDETRDAILSSTGDLIVTGYTDSTNGDITDGNNGYMDIFVFCIDALSGEIKWNKTYGASSDDSPDNIFEVDDGYVIVGNTTSINTDEDLKDANTGGFEGLIIKIDYNGTKKWDKLPGGTGNDYLYCGFQLADGNLVFVGKTDSTASADLTYGSKGGTDILIIETNSSGAMIWNKTYGGTLNDYGRSVIETSYGSIMLVGASYSSDGDITDGNSGDRDGLVMELNPKGALLWSKTYGGTLYDRFDTIMETISGNFIVAGSSYSSDGNITDGNNGESDLILYQIDKDGDKISDYTYGGRDNEGGYTSTKVQIQYANDGSYLLSGYAESADYDVIDRHSGSTAWDYWLLKLRSDYTYE